MAEADIKLVITMMANGAINVQGPIENKVLCYGMIGAAQDAICEYHQNLLADKRIQVPSLHVPGVKMKNL